MIIVDKDRLRAFYKLFYLQLYVSGDQWKHSVAMILQFDSFYMKIGVRIFLQIQLQICFYLFFVILQKPKTRIKFSGSG